MAVTTLSDISPNNIPINAGPNDKFSGLTDDGGSSYTSLIDGSTYTIYPEKTEERSSIIKPIARGVVDWMKDPSVDAGKVADAVVATGKAVAHGVYDPIERLMTGKGTIGDMTTTALNVAGAGVPKAAIAGTDKDTLSVFFSAPKATAEKAADLKAAGKTPEEIWKEVGVVDHPEAGPLSETDDSAFKVSQDYKRFALLHPGGEAIGPSKAAFPHAELYAKVAGLGDTTATVMNEKTASTVLGHGTSAAFDPKDGGKIYTRALSEDSDALHELQHGADVLQSREGGAAPDLLEHQIKATYDNLPPYGKAYLTILNDLAKAEDNISYWVKELESYGDKLDHFTTPDGASIGTIKDGLKKWNEYKSDVEDTALRLREDNPKLAGPLEELYAITRFDSPDQFNTHDLYLRNEGEDRAWETERRAGLSSTERADKMPTFQPNTWKKADLDLALKNVQDEIDNLTGANSWKDQLMRLPRDLGLFAKTDPIPRFKTKLSEESSAGSGLSRFQSPIPEFLNSITYPKDGIKGSQFLKELQDNPTVRNSEWASLGIEIDPTKRYTKDKLISLWRDHGVENPQINSAGQRYQTYQRQDVHAGLLDPEVEYGELTLDYPLDYTTGKNRFNANNQHYNDSTLAHTRYSVRTDPSGEQYLLPEELQSDLIQKGWEKPSKSGKEISFEDALEEVRKDSWVPVEVDQFEKRPENAKLIEDYYKARIKYQETQTNDDFGAYAALEENLKKNYTSFLGKEVDNYHSPDDYISDIDRAFYDAYDKTKSSPIKSPPITKISESVRLLGDALLGKAADLGLTKIVFPPIEKIVKARFSDADSIKKALDPKSGFYQTYVTSIKKYTDELKAEFGDDVKISQKPMNYKGVSGVGDATDWKGRVRGFYHGSEPFNESFLDSVGKNLRDFQSDGSISLTDSSLSFIYAYEQAGYSLEDLLTSSESPDFSLKNYMEGLHNKAQAEFTKPVYGIEIDISGLKNKNYDLSKPKFAEGGSVEQAPTENGNSVPPGALPNEVADTVDAKLSEGEYVVPANVVRYLGLDYIEKMVNKAKEGLAKLEAQGRIGGNGPDDLPFSPEELQAHDAEMSAPEQVPHMAEGGYVAGNGGWSMTDTKDLDPETGLPMWMKKRKASTEDVRKNLTTAIHEKSTFREPTGLAGSVDKWGPDDFLHYASSKDSGVNKGLEAGVAALVPFGGLAVKARNNYLNNNVPVELDNMIKSGKDRQGNALTPQQLTDLKGAREKIGQTSQEGGHNLVDTIKTGFNNLFGPHTPEPAPTTQTTPSTSGNTSTPTTGGQGVTYHNDTEKAQRDSQASRNGFGKGGLVTRRKH